MKTSVGRCCLVPVSFSLMLLLCMTASQRARAQNLFTENFEGAFPGSNWTVGDADGNGTIAYWGRVDSAFGGEGTHGGSFKGYCAGVGYSGTTTSPAYRTYMRAYMQRTIDLGTASSAYLSFWFKIPSIELGYDSARVLVDGLPVWQRSATATAWSQASVNLSPYVGGSHTLTFQFNSDLSITGEGWYLDDITVTTNVPPPNDNFAAAEVLTGTVGSVTGSSFNATKEAGEANHAGNPGGHSVWYRLTAPINGRVGFDTFGSGIDTVLAVYTGNAVSALTLVAANDDSAVTNSRSRVTFTAALGTTYQIAVDGANGASGALTLNYRFAATNDNFANSQPLLGNAADTAGHTGETTKEPGEPNHAGNVGGHSVWYRFTASSTLPLTLSTVDATFDTLLAVYTGTSVGALTPVVSNDNVSSGSPESRLTFNTVAGTTYQIAVDGANGASGAFVLSHQYGGLPDLVVNADPAVINPTISVNTFAPGDCEVLEGCAIPGTRRLLRFTTETRNAGTADLYFGNPAGNPLFIYDPCHGHYHFFEFAAYRLRDNTGRIVATGGKVGFCLEDLVRWSPSAPGNARYTCGNQGIQAGWADQYYSGLPCQYIDITDVAPGTYNLEIEFDPSNRIPESNESNNLASISVTIPPDCTSAPANNNFSGAQLISGAPAVTNANNACATKETGEPSHAGNIGGHSVWYRWVAPSNTSYVISTEGSSFDTLLAVYTGAAVNALTVVASNDDIDDENTQSRVSFNAVAGTTYRIAVDGYNASDGGAVGNVALSINPPVNDRFSNCTVLVGASGTANGYTLGATREAGEPAHFQLPADHSVWYCWTSPGTATVQFDTEGSAFDTRLAAYSGVTIDGLTPIASDGDSGGGVTSKLIFPATGGTTYRLAVDGEDNAVGFFTLHWTMQARLVAERSPEGTFRITLIGVPGARYRIEDSSNLAEWTEVTTVTSEGTMVIDLGPIEPGRTRFVRAVSL